MNEVPKEVNRRIGHAMHTYKMLTDGDRVLVAVSGGVDSLVLAWLLDRWRRKAPIAYDLLAVHIDPGFDKSENRTALLVAEQLERLKLPYRIVQTDFGPKALAAENGKSTCYHCARQRRNKLFALAEENRITKVAFGHHKDDILETFLLNLLYGGNLSTMVPHQRLFGGKLSIIRPMALVNKEEIRQIARAVGIKPVKNPCPEDGNSKRQQARDLVQYLAEVHPQAKASMFAALANVRASYLLTPPQSHDGAQHADNS